MLRFPAVARVNEVLTCPDRIKLDFARAHGKHLQLLRAQGLRGAHVERSACRNPARREASRQHQACHQERRDRAPMPTASASTAVADTTGCLTMWRSASRISVRDTGMR